jgi:dihydrofolate synthase/folylpolyglutamate synthase
MRPLPDYAAAVAYLEDLTARPILSREEAGLARVETLLAAMGHPERRFATIQVAGTNGKGSTTTMAAAVLIRAGLRTGAFTSPHLQSYRERIALDGVPIDARSWVDLLNRLLPILARMEANDLPGYTYGRAAFLDVLWTMACLAFVERGVRCAVAETGQGGRLDPVTANDAAVAVLTNVSLDHVERLGHTVEAIAREKAGLIKPGQLVITAASAPALAVIRAACTERGATLWTVGEESEVGIIPEGDGPDAPFALRTPLRTHRGIRLAMRGQHQRFNAACAAAAVDALALRTGIEVPARGPGRGPHTGPAGTDRR